MIDAGFAEFVRCLVDQLATVNKDKHDIFALRRHSSDFTEDDGLAGAGGHDEQDAVVLTHCDTNTGDGLLLVRAEAHGVIRLHVASLGYMVCQQTARTAYDQRGVPRGSSLLEV